MPEISEIIQWSIPVPIFRNSIIMQQLGIAIGIPFGLLVAFLIIVKATYALGFIAALFLFTFLFMLVVWGGKYNVGFELDWKGIRNFTIKDQARKNRIINTLAVFAGLLAGKPAVAGAGMLAHTRQNILIKWSSIRKVKFYPERQMMIVRAGFTENIAIFCTTTNYAEVESFIRIRLKDKDVFFTSG